MILCLVTEIDPDGMTAVDATEEQNPNHEVVLSMKGILIWIRKTSVKFLH